MGCRLLDDLELDRDRRIVLAMGGSLGASAINRAVCATLDAAEVSPDPRWAKLAIIHVGGQRASFIHKECERACWKPGMVQYRTVGYLKDAPAAMSCCNFYVGRSGAATVGELAAAGIPALLIPDPQHGDQQQLFNAEYLVHRGQGTVCNEDQVSGESILEWLRSVWDKPRHRAGLAPPADDIADDLIEVWSSS
jgi:UDP-N-acetylglucosamine--N-acetylmuramyl-(pentapeptide) pyrophosphoryl-undecaprenol N-acetylglucosamine transferase